jgi:predicted transcriptional regulator
MQHSKILQWIERERKRRETLMGIHQPLTAKQISARTGIDLDRCSYILGKFARRGLVVCLNPAARNSRVYWTTPLGRKVQDGIQPGYTKQCKPLGELDWELYGWVCFSHRQAIVKILTSPMQPAEMKRMLRRYGSTVTISSNNIRDVIRLFLKRGLVRKVFCRKKAHPRYELTETGIKLQELLLQAMAPHSL